jgi:hypothetical protein
MKKNLILKGAGNFDTMDEFANNPMETVSKNPLILIIGGVFFLIIIIVIIIIIRNNNKRKKNEPELVSLPINGSKAAIIDSSLIPKSSSYEYTINFWIFVRDWNYNYGKPKCILYRGDQNCNNASPMVFLYPKTNNLMIRFSTEENKKYPLNPFKCAVNDDELFNTLHKCDVANIPIQRWVQVTISLWNTTTDVYINGKLARSCTHNSIPLIMDNSNLYLCQGGGFNGYLSRLTYYNYCLDALSIYKLYNKGPTPAKGLFTSFSKIKLNCGDSDDDTTTKVPDGDAFQYSEVETCSS